MYPLGFSVCRFNEDLDLPLIRAHLAHIYCSVEGRKGEGQSASHAVFASPSVTHELTSRTLCSNRNFPSHGAGGQLENLWILGCPRSVSIKYCCQQIFTCKVSISLWIFFFLFGLRGIMIFGSTWN